MKKILAVDLGISSFGFAVCIENDTNSYTCIDHGVIMRNTPYDKQGNSSQSEFSQKRRLSKLYHKRKKRIKKIAEIFDQYEILALHKALSIQKSNPVTDKWSLRATTAFQRALSPEELFAIFSHMAKHRGYKSIATEDLLWELEKEQGIEQTKKSKQTDEQGSVYQALSRLEKLKSDYPDKTIAQIIDLAVQNGTFQAYRNHNNYEKMIRREDIEEEIEKIIYAQYEMNAIPLNQEAFENFLYEIKHAITFQEESQIDPSLFGRCSFLHDEKVAPKYSYLYDYYRLYKHLADLQITNYEITTADREKIVDYINKKVAKGQSVKQLTYKEIRKILGLSPEQKIFGKEDIQRLSNNKTADRHLVKFHFLSKIKPFKNLVSAIQKHPDSLTIFRHIADILQQHKSPKSAFETIKELLNNYTIVCEDQELEILKMIQNKTPGSLSISHAYIEQALPYFFDGLNESEIKERLGVSTIEDYSHFPKSLKHLHLGKDNLFEQKENPINNHAVKSLASWALRRIADLSWRYGVFDEIILESARDALPKSIKDAIDKGIKEKEKKIDTILKTYQKEFPTLNRKDARKILLWESQKGMDIFTGEMIGIHKLFSGEADIEHIVPQSLGGLWTEHNLVIALKDTNVQKSNRLPMDWLQHDQAYIRRVEDLYHEGRINWKKRKNLLATSLDDIYKEVSESKSMRATSYLEALVAQNLKMFYPFNDKQRCKDGLAVRTIPGKTTSKARLIFDIKSKSRDTNFHHAEDALILATLSRGWQNRLHRLLKANYGKSEKELKEVWQHIVPSIEGISLKEYISEAFERFMSKGEDSLFYHDMHGGIRSISYLIDKKPLSASSHKETIYSGRHKDPKNPNRILPTIRKDILEAFNTLDILKHRHKWDASSFKEVYQKELRHKLWLYIYGNHRDETLRAIDQRAEDIAQLIEEYAHRSQSDKEVDEHYQKLLKRFLSEPIRTNHKIIRKARFVNKINYFKIDRGLVETDKNLLALFVSKGAKDQLIFQRIDVNNRKSFEERTLNGLIIYLNEMIFLFKKNEVIHYGCLRSYVEQAKRIALFNPRFPDNPKAQPKKFSTGSQIKQVGIGSATGIIKVKLDMNGRVVSYQKFGFITPENEQYFLKESGYGGMENSSNH